MTRKDYQLIAAAVKESRPHPNACYPDRWHVNYTCDRIALKLADSLGKDNSAFNRDKFLTACGVE